MMRKKKVLVITGSRAEYGLLRPVIRNIQDSGSLSLRLLVTGMHTLRQFGYTVQEVRREMPVHAVVPIDARDSMIAALAKELRGIESYARKEKPDLILVLGDRDEAFAGAVVGGHLKIAVAHIHGGDTLGYLVDEAIRHSITKFAHIHFPATKASARRIAQMGEKRSRIHAFGSTAFDASEVQRARTRWQLAQEFGLDPRKRWLLVVQHPTPLDPVPLGRQLAPTLRALRKHPAQKIVIYPNSDTGAEDFIRELEKLRGSSDTLVVRTLERDRYLGFLKACDAMVGNSSSGIIEAGYFRRPVVNIGGRQTGRECGKNVIHVGYNEDDISRALTKVLSSAFMHELTHMKHPYGAGDASRKIVGAIEKLRITDELFHKRFVLQPD